MFERKLLPVAAQMMHFQMNFGVAAQIFANFAAFSLVYSLKKDQWWMFENTFWGGRADDAF